METFTSKALMKVQEVAKRVLNFLMFWSLLLMLIFLPVVEVFFDNQNFTGPTWGITMHIASYQAGFSQYLRQLGWMGVAIFFWWAAAYLWTNRHTGFFTK